MTGALWCSGYVAALFALHPLHVESVAWVAERKDLLCAFFWILTMSAYAFYVERPRLNRYLVSFPMCCVGLDVKTYGGNLPFVLLLLDYWPLKRLTFKEAATGDHARFQSSGLIFEKSLCSYCRQRPSALTVFAQTKEGAFASLAKLPMDLRSEMPCSLMSSTFEKMIMPFNLDRSVSSPDRFALVERGNICAPAGK